MRTKFFPAVVLCLFSGATAIVTGCGGVSESVPPPPAATLKSIAVTPATPSVAVGATEQFKATGTYSDSSTKDLTTSATWSSGNTAVGTVGAATGLATAVAPGTATITAASGSISGQTTLTVPAPTLTSIAVSATAQSLAMGLTLQFTATGTYSDSSTKDLTATASWSSSKTSVATISSAGLASAVALGSTTISATSSGVTGTSTLTVTAAALVSIAVTANSLSPTMGMTDQFTATGTYTDSTTQNLTSSATWTSSNPSVATISAAGLASAAAQGTTTITAASGSVTPGTAQLSVQASPERSYSATASVGDFLTLSIDATAGTLAYQNLSNGTSGTVTYTVNADGTTSFSDPGGNLLSLAEWPGYGIIALINNAGSTKDQLALVTSVSQQAISLSTFENHSYNMLELRTNGGGVGVATIAIDGSGNLSGSEYMPFNLLSSTPQPFNTWSYSLAAAVASTYYLELQTAQPPDGYGNNYIFGVPNGTFIVDNQDASIIGLPKASSADFNSAWANTYKLTYYAKTNANGPTGNTPEAGDPSWGVYTLAVDDSGNITLTDSQDNTIIPKTLLVPIANTPSLYDGTSATLSDPCYGLFTISYTNSSNGQAQQVFVAFTQGAVLLSSFSTYQTFTPGNDYNYFYGVGLPESSAAIATNAGSSSNPGGSSTAYPAGAWGSLASAYSASTNANRLYVGASANGDLLSITIDPSASPSTLTYYDYTNGNSATVGYVLNGNGSSTVTDASSNVQGALELPDQMLMLEMANVGFNLPPTAPPVLVMALPQMNLTTADFLSQNYNFMQFRTMVGDETIGAMAIDGSGNFTATGYTPWNLLGPQPSSPVTTIDPLTFPGGTYPGPIVSTTDLVASSPLYQRSDYIFGYPGSLVLINSATWGTAVGLPQTTSSPLVGTYEVMFFRRQVGPPGSGAGFYNPDQYGENGPTTGVDGVGQWKGLNQVRGASMGMGTLTINGSNLAELYNSDSSEAWQGTLQPFSSISGSSSFCTADKTQCDGLYTMTLNNGSGSTAQTIEVFLGFVPATSPGTQPAVVLSTLTTNPNAGPSTTNYQYRYGVGFWLHP